MLAGDHFVEHHTGGVEVSPGVGLGKAELLRGGVAGGAHDPGIGIVVGIGHPGDVEVDEHKLAAPENDVFRLDIPVDDARLVQRREGVAELAEDVRRRLRRQPFSRRKARVSPGMYSSTTATRSPVSCT